MPESPVKQNRFGRFNNLLCHITPPQLFKAYTHPNKKSARGVDGESWKNYGNHLSQRLKDLHHRIHSLKYMPQPVKHIYIPKANGAYVYVV